MVLSSPGNTGRGATGLRPSPKQIFAIVGLALIAVIAISTSLSQAVFFRQAIIERESKLIDDVVDAAALGADTEPPDMINFRGAATQREFARRFGMLNNLPGVDHIKVFNRNLTIVWSDDPGLIGTRQTRHPQDLKRALGGEIRTIYSQFDQFVSTFSPSTQ